MKTRKRFVVVKEPADVVDAILKEANRVNRRPHTVRYYLMRRAVKEFLPLKPEIAEALT